jgi:group I intron endonuclease
MILNQDEFSKVVGEIYKITNKVTGKCYVGQTRSHRLNHNKYRPFGFMGRFKDHIHEAYSTKKNICRYLNSSILKYGGEQFTCELLMTCDIADLDFYEVHFIQEFHTKFPNGYNLTDGGQGIGFQSGAKITLPESEIQSPPLKERASMKKSDYTKNLISERLKEALNQPDHLAKMMQLTQKQHLSKKFDRFANVTVDESDIDKYIKVRTNHVKNEPLIRVMIDNVATTFVGKFESIEDIKERAREFIRELVKRQNTLLLETPTESTLPLQFGNTLEELG